MVRHELPGAGVALLVSAESERASSFELRLTLSEREHERGSWDAALEVAYAGAAPAEARIAVALEVPPMVWFQSAVVRRWSALP